MGMNINELGINPYIYLASAVNRNSSVSRQNGVSFTDIMAAKGVENTEKTGTSFEEMWKSKYPGAYYHVMDASKISQGVWERNDFPREKFFQDEVDDSILDWKPSGADPAMTDPSVQSQLDSILGKKSIIVPPELEEKMKNDPELAKKVMEKVDNFITTHPTRPGRILSYLISLDENGDIAHFSVTGGGGNISQSTSRADDDYFERKDKEAECRRLQVKEQEKKAIERRKLAQEEYLNQQMESQQRLQSLLMDSTQNGSLLAENAYVQATNVSTIAADAYEQSSIAMPSI